MVAIVDISSRFWPLSWLDRRQQVAAYGRSRGAILDIARRYGATLGEEVAVVTNRAPGRGRALLYLGHVLGWGGLALSLLGLLWLDEADLGKLVFGPFGAGLLMQLPSGALVRAGRRHLRPTRAELLAADKRRPALLLRSFRAAGLSAPDAPLAAEDIVASLEHFGPFIEVGKPGEEIVPIAEGRARFGEVDEQSTLERWMDHAVLLVVMPRTAEPVAGEIEAIARRRHGHKTLVVMPPRAAGAGGDWAGLRAALSGLPEFRDLPEKPPEGLIALHSSTAGEPILITGAAMPGAADYDRAIAFAVYGMKCHGRW